VFVPRTGPGQRESAKGYQNHTEVTGMSSAGVLDVFS
jgi:hypothetical protein